VLPEDTNPLVQKLSRMALFAPNWWRTMGELMAPAYQRSGIFENPKAAAYAAQSGLKSTAAMLALSHVGGNLMTRALSGHLSHQHQPGHQNDVEITNPWLLHRLQDMGLLPEGVDPSTGINPATGARMTMRNPLGGQMEDVEQAAGLQSGQPGKRIGPGV